MGEFGFAKKRMTIHDAIDMVRMRVENRDAFVIGVTNAGLDRCFKIKYQQRYKAIQPIVRTDMKSVADQWMDDIVTYFKSNSLYNNRFIEESSPLIIRNGVLFELYVVYS